MTHHLSYILLGCSFLVVDLVVIVIVVVLIGAVIVIIAYI